MGNKKNILLYPFSLIYGAITGIRNFMYNTKILSSYEFDLPVICVGNITVGGTGKTPHTEYIISLLLENFKVATLSRGYKRKSSGFRIANASDHVKEIGDESMQIYRKFPDIIVAVDANRVRGVNSILKEKPETQIIILDDGFQHRKIAPGLTILLTDFNRLMIRDHLLPYGLLRESKNNMKRADVILVTKSPENIPPIQRRIIVKEINKAPYQNLFFTSFKYKEPVPVLNNVDFDKIVLDKSLKKGSGIVLVTGIANPLPLKEYLNNYFDEIIHICFPDHHRFNERDLLRIESSFNDLKATHKLVFTTEKDAVRFREIINITHPVKSFFYYIPVGVVFLNNDKDTFDNLILDYVRKNKRNNTIS
jgi:tetraacyldisaccharide 4'-kinase